MKKTIYIQLLLLLLAFPLFAQNDTVKYEVEMMGLTSTGGNAPFWLQNRQYGKTAFNASSDYFLAGLGKDFSKKTGLFDYGFKANALLQTSSQSTKIYFHELYFKARYSIFDLIVGAREEYLGSQDSTLSCGGFLFSHNARPMPKIALGIEHFMPVPFTKGFLEVKGAMSHGWFIDNISINNVYLHHKYLYLRFGGKLPVHFQYGADHVAQWSGENSTLGKQPSGFKDFVKIFMGKSGGDDANRSDQINALGNHIISQNMKLEADIKDFKVACYWQNITEDSPIRPIWKTMNRPDGLWGITLRNSKFPYIKGILFEYLNTTDQSGPFHDKDGVVYGGTDAYFQNGGYPSGWSYYNRTIGTPFISSPVYNKNGEFCTTNNRVQVHHFGIEGDVTGYQYLFLASFSKNYGLNALNMYERKNTSLLLEVKKQFPHFHNIECGLSVGSDFGKFYSNSTGCMLTVRKTGNLFRY